MRVDMIGLGLESPRLVWMMVPAGTATEENVGTLAQRLEPGDIVVRPARRLLLLYVNHRPEDAAWLEELQVMERGWPDFRLLPVMAAMNRSSQSWSGRAGRIDADMLKSVGADLVRPVYYAAGAPGMVAAMRAVLNDCGVGDDDIRGEDFHGY